MPRVLLISAALAISACGGGGDPPSPTPAPTPAPTPSPLPTPTPSPTPTPTPTPSPSPGASTVCGSAFLGRATAQFSDDSCERDAVCATERPANAVDNNRDTAAQIVYAGVPGTVTLVAQTQAGVVVPAGRMAGALIALTSETAVSTTLSFNTYLDNVMQETGGRVSNVLSPSTTTTPNFYRFANAKPYDRIDVVLEQSGSVTANIFEVCSE